MKIKIELVLSLILQAVKDETHLKSVIDRSTDDKAAKVAYNEDAGDEEFHERKLLRGIYTSLDMLKAELVEYLDNVGYTVADNVIITSIDSATDSITIMFDVNESFNKAFTDSLARLFSKFIEDSVLVLWWGPINQNQASFYTNLQQMDLVGIRKAFTKKASTSLATPYTSAITLEGSQVSMLCHEEETVTYTIDDNCIDDIEIECSSRIIQWNRDPRNHSLTIKAIHKGVCDIRLFSIHDESVSVNLRVIVKHHMRPATK